MAILIIHQGADWNQELYDQAMERVIPDQSNPPEGMVASFAAPGENGGWRVVDIWESEADWESFRNGTLIPGIQEMQGPPFSSEISQLHNKIVSQRVTA